MMLMARWRAARKTGPKLVAVTVDHGLRAEAKREAAAVARLARKLGFPHRTLRWTGIKPKTGLQEAARNARYRLLAAAARQAGASAYPHRAYARRSGRDRSDAHEPRQWARPDWRRCGGCPNCRRRPGLHLVRPLLGIPKARLLATLKAAKIALCR